MSTGTPIQACQIMLTTTMGRILQVAGQAQTARRKTLSHTIQDSSQPMLTAFSILPTGIRGMAHIRQSLANNAITWGPEVLFFTLMVWKV